MSKFLILFFSISFFILFRVQGAQLTDDGTLIQTKDGLVEGLIEAGYRQFRGIPFAQPPVGELRWMDPQPVIPWNGVYLAKEFKSSCPQHCILPHLLCPQNYSEDCLHLNVFAPLLNYSSSLLPVMVFLYGGAYFQGTSLSPLYSPEYLVKNGVIVVTFEYRLGALGFLTNRIVKGNFAIHDQREVLKWIQVNIKNFGGDPTQVTLFGESAGAMATSIHLISPLSKGLFSKVILESDPYSLEIPSYEQMVLRVAPFASILGCSTEDMNCLRSKDIESVIKASDDTFSIPDPRDNLTLEAVMQWRPHLDPDEIPMQVKKKKYIYGFLKVFFFKRFYMLLETVLIIKFPS